MSQWSRLQLCLKREATKKENKRKRKCNREKEKYKAIGQLKGSWRSVTVATIASGKCQTNNFPLLHRSEHLSIHDRDIDLETHMYIFITIPRRFHRSRARTMSRSKPRAFLSLAALYSNHDITSRLVWTFSFTSRTPFMSCLNCNSYIECVNEIWVGIYYWATDRVLNVIMTLMMQ